MVKRFLCETSLLLDVLSIKGLHEMNMKFQKKILIFFRGALGGWMGQMEGEFAAHVGHALQRHVAVVGLGDLAHHG